MAKEPKNTIAKISPNAALPAFLQRAPDAQPEGIADLKQYVTMPRLKMVQKQARSELLAKYMPGDLIITPTLVTVQPIGERGLKQGPPFLFTPVFFFADWATWNPIELAANMPMIQYQTADKNDPIVAKSRDRNLRMEPIMEGDKQMQRNGKPMFRRHVEQLNFVCVGHDVEGLGDMPFIMTFARGEHNAGSKFAGLVRMRNADIYGCVFQARAAHRERNGNDWYGVDVEQPEGASPWVTEEQYARFKTLYEGFKATHSTQGLRADVSDAEDIAAAEEPTVDTANRSM